MNKSSSTPADQQVDAVATEESGKDSGKKTTKKSTGKTASKTTAKSKAAPKTKTASTRSTAKKSVKADAEAEPAAVADAGAEASSDSAKEKKPRAKRAATAAKSPAEQSDDAVKAKPAAKKSAGRSKAAGKTESGADAANDAANVAEDQPKATAKSAPKGKSAAVTTAKKTEDKPAATEAQGVADGEEKKSAAKAPARGRKPAARKSAVEVTEAPATGADAQAAAKPAGQTPEHSPEQSPKQSPEQPSLATEHADARADQDASPEAKAPARGRTAGTRGRGRRGAASKSGADAEAAATSEISPAAEARPELQPDHQSEHQSARHADGQTAEPGDLAGEEHGEAPRSRNGRRKGKNGRDKQARSDRSEKQERQGEKSKSSRQKPEDRSGTEEQKDAPGGKRKMFVSVLPGEQVEVAIAEEGVVQEYYVEMLHQVKVKGNIYKGVIHNVDPNLQAAFVSYGAVKNGFLQIDEVHPEYYLTPHEQGKGHKYPLIQKVLKPGQEILVQVVKEPSGTKGAFLTSYLSLPGRFLVLTPGREQIGVSRKVENDDERGRLREMLSGLNPGPGLGVIVRTVSMGASKTSLQRDLQFLKRVWRDVRKKGSTEKAPAIIYQELGLAARAVRDYLTEDVVELWVDDQELADQIKDVIAMLFPRRSNLLQMHNTREQDLFERFGLKKQIEQVHSREVVLPSGARLVFDHTEALTAIDINSGKTAGKTNFEDMAFRINLEAAQNIPLQLRLRDIGGQIVVDFIEMRDRNHWREVERAFRNAMRQDRARHDVAKISSFGLLQVVRQRLGSSAISIATELCPCCRGTGQRRNMEWQSLQALKDIQRLIRQNGDNNGKTIHYTNQAELVLYLLNHKKERLLDMEKNAGVVIELKPES